MSLPAPNHTQTPNALLDELLPQIDSLAELKVTLAIVRQTFGWHRQEKVLSISRLEELTGLSREGVVSGTKKALERGHVERVGAGRSYAYRLRVDSQRSGLSLVSDSDQEGQGQLVSDSDTEKERTSGSGKKTPSGDDEFAEWLEHYHETTGRKDVRGSRSARRAFSARRRGDEYTVAQLKDATTGCHRDDWCRERGFDVPDTILRASNVDRYIALASKSESNGRKASGSIASIRRDDTPYGESVEHAQHADDNDQAGDTDGA